MDQEDLEDLRTMEYMTEKQITSNYLKILKENYEQIRRELSEINSNNPNEVNAIFKKYRIQAIDPHKKKITNFSILGTFMGESGTEYLKYVLDIENRMKGIEKVTFDLF